MVDPSSNEPSSTPKVQHKVSTKLSCLQNYYPNLIKCMGSHYRDTPRKESPYITQSESKKESCSSNKV